MKVRVAVHGRYHAFSLASGLHAAGCLELLQTTYPEFIARRTLTSDLPLDCFPSIEAVRRLAQSLGLHAAINPWAARVFAQRVAERLTESDADILVGWSSAILEGLELATQKGIKTIVERGSSHIQHQSDILEEATLRLGLARPQITPPEIISRELREYELADLITVPSQIAARTFIERGVDAERVFVNPLGVDLGQFRPRSSRRSGDTVRIISVGAIGVRKGTSALIEACAKVGDAVELVLVGPIERDFRAVLARLPMDNVTLAGPLRRDVIHQAYADADIFCLPSVEEGFGMSVLEAMASGLPVVVSDQVGATDVIEDGVSGFVVPVFEIEALTEILSRLVHDNELRDSIGHDAVDAVQSMSGWDAYISRTLSRYRELLAS